MEDEKVTLPFDLAQTYHAYNTSCRRIARVGSTAVRIKLLRVTVGTQLTIEH